jgi:Origin of replication binding protein
VARLVADDVKRSARATCDHRKCAGHKLHIRDAPVSMTDALDCVRTRTLHTQELGVAWGERYCEPEMRPLPTLPFVCVRAQMGLGKTKAVVRHMRETCTPATSVLVVSYSIELCKRLNAIMCAGTGLDFALYLDVCGDITCARTTVCLDSLPRCVKRKYDLVVIDEVHSVLSHFHSPHMRDRGLVSHKLERFLASADRVLLVDAVSDSTLVKLVVDRVDRVEGLRGEHAFWVRNDFVRPTARRMELHVADRRSGGGGSGVLTEDSLKYRAMEATFRRLRAGENVVHVSNTRSHVVAVEEAFKKLYPGEAYAAYYGEGPRKRRDAAEEWRGLRLLTYSPAITAGISFEERHFHALVAYVDNSPHAPGVDTVAQMLYRVRDLSAGEMEVFMQSAPAAVSLPRTVREVSELLLGSHALTKRYLDDLHVHFEATRRLDDDGSALYDRTRMSWDVLVGTLVCKNRSLVNGPALLAATMAEDYGVAVTMRRADTGAGAYGDDRALELEDARACAAPREAVPSQT